MCNIKDTNTITKPFHYQFSKACYEVRDVIRDRLNALIKAYPVLAGDLAYDVSNSIKYNLRWFDKGGLEDLKKAKYCIESIIEIIEKHESILKNEPCTKEQTSTY